MLPAWAAMGYLVVTLWFLRKRLPFGRAAAIAASVVLAGWTTVVWVVRAADIALGGDHEAAFIAVHVVLAVVSTGLAAWAVITDRKVRTSEHTSALTASQEHMA